MSILIRLDFFQKANGDSGKTEEQLTYSLEQGNSEKCQEQNVDLYMTFVVLTKAFDTSSCEGLWKMRAKFGYPARFIALISNGAAIPWWHACTGRLLWTDSCNNWSQARLCTTDTNTVQHDVPRHAYSSDAFQYCDGGFSIRYRFDGKLFNIRMLQAKSKVQTDVLDELLYTICRWHDKECLNREEHDRWSLIQKGTSVALSLA